MTSSRILQLDFDKAIGFTTIDSSIHISTIILKSFCIKFSSADFYATDQRIYLRMIGLSGCVLSNLGNINGIALPYTNTLEGSLWTPGLEMTISQKIGDRIDFELVKQTGEAVEFTHIQSLQIVFQVKF